VVLSSLAAQGFNYPRNFLVGSEFLPPSVTTTDNLLPGPAVSCRAEQAPFLNWMIIR